MDCNITTALYLIVIVTKIVCKLDAAQEQIVYRHIFRLNQLDVRTKVGSTLLHLAASVDTPVDEFHTSDICRFYLFPFCCNNFPTVLITIKLIDDHIIHSRQCIYYLDYYLFEMI